MTHPNPYSNPVESQNLIVLILGSAVLLLVLLLVFLSGDLELVSQQKRSSNQRYLPQETKHFKGQFAKPVTDMRRKHPRVPSHSRTDAVVVANPVVSPGKSMIPQSSVLKPTRVIKTPRGTQPSGLTYHDGHFYMSSYILAAGIYQIRAADGAVVQRFNPPVDRFRGRYGGLAMNGAELVHVQANNNHRRIFDSLTIKNLKPGKQLKLPVQPDCSDLAIHDQKMWFVSAHHSTRTPAAPQLYEVDLRQGRVIRKVSLPFAAQEQNHGLTYGNGSLFLSAGNTVVRMNPKTFEVVERFHCNAQRLESLAWDGKHVWAASFHGGIYRVPFDSSVASQKVSLDSPVGGNRLAHSK